MLAKSKVNMMNTAKRDFHLKGNDENLIVWMVGTSSIPFMVDTEASPKAESLYFPFSILTKKSPRVSR